MTKQTAYVTLAGRTFIVGHYEGDDSISVREQAREDLAAMLKLRIWPAAVNEHRPYLAALEAREERLKEEED